MIDISPNDDRQYRYVKLSNSLEVLLIHDSNTEKSAACCDVKIGSMADNVEAQGLAHFLEHMLFLGTEKYPQENSYSSYLSSHGGASNAYTDQENTVYYFDIQNEHFEEALNMFASFFICPLFTDTATQRELNAVDSENTKNLQSDTWRQYQLFKSLASSDHPFSKFSTGNLDTLKAAPEKLNINIRDLVIAFHEKYYSANIMKLVLIGKDSLDVLEAYAQGKFSAIPNKDVTVPSVPSDPFSLTQMGRVVALMPVKDVKELDVYFPIPPVEALYHSKPNRYLAHLIGHESEGSILHALKTRGLANALGAMTHTSLTDFAVFRVNVELTDEGVAHVDDVIACIFAYIGMMNRECIPPASTATTAAVDLQPQQWIQSELSALMDMTFRFEEATDAARYATHLANNMHLYPPLHYVTGDKLLFTDDTASVAPLLQCLTVSRALVFIKHRNSLTGVSDATRCVEPHYSTEYTTNPFSPSQLEQWNRSYEGSDPLWSSMIALPMPNEFVPTDFTLRSTVTVARADTISSTSGIGGNGASATASATATSIMAIRGEDNEGEEESSSVSLVAGPNLLIRVMEQGATVAIEGGENKETTASASSSGEIVTPSAGALSLPALPGTALLTWFKQDSYWQVPKLNVTVTLDCNLTSVSPLGIALTDLLARCLKEALSAYSYYADCAGLGFDVTLSRGGIELNFNGFQHKLPVLVEKAILEIKKMSLASSSDSGAVGYCCSMDVFARMKEKLLRDYRNYAFWQPYYHCVMGTINCLEEPRWTQAERYHALKGASLLDLSVFATQFMRQLKVEVFIHGNASAAEAHSLSQSVLTQLSTTAQPASLAPTRRVVDLSAGTCYLYKQDGRTCNPAEVNSACENLYVIGQLAASARATAVSSTGVDGSISDRMPQFSDVDENGKQQLLLESLSELMAHLLSEPAFDRLRTQLQLGYIVHTSIKKIGTVYGVHIIVQSSHKSPAHLDECIENFLRTYRNTILTQLTPTELQSNVTAVIETLTEKPKNLDEESNGHMEEIRGGTYLFGRKHLLAQILSDTKFVTLDRLIAFYDEYFIQKNTRKKFCSQFTGSGARTTASDVSDTAFADTAVAATVANGTAVEATVEMVAVSSATGVHDDVSVSSEEEKVVVISSHSHFKKSMALLPAAV